MREIASQVLKLTVPLGGMELLKVLSEAHGQALHEDVSMSLEDSWPDRPHPAAQDPQVKGPGRPLQGGRGAGLDPRQSVSLSLSPQMCGSCARSSVERRSRKHVNLMSPHSCF